MEHILYIVVPCYNEEEVLEVTANVLKAKMQGYMNNNKVSTKSKICFVDDGSKDDTWEIIERLHKEDSLFSGIKLTRNRGHQNALLCGLMTVKNQADMVISMDADLQDDIDAMDEMIDKYLDGYDVVYGVRSARKTDTFFKRFTAESFYKIMSFFGAEVVFNHADYRLMSKKALDGLESFEDVNLFLRGMVPMVGLPSCNVYYERKERFAGESKYPLKKMLSFAFEGITSLSVKPIKLILSLGSIIFMVSIGILIYSLIQHFNSNTVSGWTSLIVSIWALGGLQLIAIGIIGQYIGKVYLETKRRPRFLVETFLDEKEQEKNVDE